MSSASIPAEVGDAVTAQAIASVEPVIRPYLRRTPVISVDRLDFGLPPGPAGVSQPATPAIPTGYTWSGWSRPARRP